VTPVKVAVTVTIISVSIAPVTVEAAGVVLSDDGAVIVTTFVFAPAPVNAPLAGSVEKALKKIEAKTKDVKRL
jgi:hypothetical protein